MPAQFPNQPPELFDNKTTANDVGDASHWDGADANAVKAEIVAIAAKLGVDGDASESSHDWKLNALEARAEISPASGTLDASTATVVADERVAETSTILVQSTCAAFAALGVYLSARDAGSFTLVHATAAGTETFDYIVVN